MFFPLNAVLCFRRILRWCLCHLTSPRLPAVSRKWPELGLESQFCGNRDRERICECRTPIKICRLRQVEIKWKFKHDCAIFTCGEVILTCGEVIYMQWSHFIYAVKSFLHAVKSFFTCDEVIFTCGEVILHAEKSFLHAVTTHILHDTKIGLGKSGFSVLFWTKSNNSHMLQDREYFPHHTH